MIQRLFFLKKEKVRFKRVEFLPGIVYPKLTKWQYVASSPPAHSAFPFKKENWRMPLARNASATPTLCHATPTIKTFENTE